MKTAGLGGYAMLKRGRYCGGRWMRLAASDVISANRAEDQRGMALIGVMLIMSLLLMLALAVTFTSLSDKSITSNFKNLTSGFYAAEAGVNNLHRLLRNDKFILASLTDPPSVAVGQPTLNPEAFIVAAEQAFNKTESFPNNAAYKTKIKILDLQMPYPAGDIDPAHASQRVKLINPYYPRLGQVEPYSVSYQLESVGEGISGLNGSVTLVEEGVVNFNLLVRAEGGGVRVGSFSEFALFNDKFDPYNPEGPFIYQGLGPGDRFAGRIHTNERFGFWTVADGSDAPTFRGYVTQAYRSASYYRHGAGMPPPPIDADSDIVDGVLVAPKFLAGFDRGVDPIPPTANAFDQARAVLDGGYELSGGPPTDGELHTALRAAGDLTTPLTDPTDPTSTSPTLPKGVYLPTDGESFSGSGIYVMGDADQIQLTADPSGDRQIIKITQGRQTTTIVIDIAAATTTVDAGNGTRTLRGIPKDRSIVEKGNRSAASLYVRGNVTSLFGPGRDEKGQPIPAIDSNFAVTVTAGGTPTGDSRVPVSGGSITLTGDLTYETPVVDPAGNPINPDANNVLGIFASGGNINIPGDGTAPDNLTVHASMAAFELKDANGEGLIGANGRPFGGRIRSDVLNFMGRPFRGNFNLVGGMQSTNYDNLGVYDGQFHGYMYKGKWDPRYDNGQSPPFYPGYVVDSGGPTGAPTVKAQTNSPVVLSYKRIYYGRAESLLGR
ncbi:MAG TPA: PilX N-terminal domain-containing pilus assembly protein [Blastocatellia bacterium]|nr:PilX N-terminal domain-containing pilus assembly protein [Blastocatellia bacterium]